MRKYPYQGPAGSPPSHQQTISDLPDGDREEMMNLIDGVLYMFSECEVRLRSYAADEQPMDAVHHQLRFAVLASPRV
jgi:hypothetical protein